MTTHNDKQFPRFVATWEFGQAVAEKALEVATSGHSMLDAIEQGIWVAEVDAQNATVGFGGLPNADGVVQLDACIMSGPDHGAGSVAAVADTLHPISLARLVMERTPHVMLAGAGARKYASELGMEVAEMLSPDAEAAWKKWKADKARKSIGPHQDDAPDIEKEPASAEAAPGEQLKKHPDHHDTISLVGIDENGDLYGGCSTSGWGFKIPGRVGDSPIIGGGVYVDNEMGAVGATGTGENVMRWCASFWITQLMGDGLAPTAAIEKVIRDIERKDPLGFEKLAINFIAINKDGQTGAAGTSRGFVCAVVDPTGSELQSVVPIEQ